MRQKIFKIMIMLFFLPGMALAHTGIGETTGFMHGVGHKSCCLSNSGVGQGHSRQEEKHNHYLENLLSH
jgi:hypothetical protein